MSKRRMVTTSGGWAVPLTGTIIHRRGRYVVVLDHGKDAQGRRIRPTKHFRTLREAKEYQAANAQHPVFGAGVGPYGSRDLRMTAFLHRWLEHVRKDVRESTFIRYEQFVRVHIVPALGQVRLANLSPEMVDRFHDGLLAKVSPTTARHVAVVLRQSLNIARHPWGLILSNPSTDVKLPKVREYSPVVWTQEQATRFLREAQGTKHYLLFAMLAGTGMRLDDALSLRWNDVDFSKGTVFVRQGKTAKARRLILLPTVLLDELRPVRGIGEALVFPSRTGKKLDPSTVLETHFYPLLKRLGLPRIRLHDLRHLHGSFLVQQGVDIATVSARLGHASKAFTLSRYVHLMGGQEGAAAVMDGMFEAANQQPTALGGNSEAAARLANAQSPRQY